jgi:hypothetical protein
MNLDRYFHQRSILLGSRAASLALLCDLDRQLLELARRQSEGIFANQQQRPWQERWLLAEAVDKCQPGFLLDYCRRVSIQEQWSMASLRADLPCPSVSTNSWSGARAVWLNPARQTHSPPHWQPWLQALHNPGCSQQLQSLYTQYPDNQPQVMVPLLLRVDTAQVVQFVNELSKQLSAVELLPWLGLSCLGRFVPWLHTLTATPALQYPAQAELTWLTGNRTHTRTERQAWGMSINTTTLQQLRQSLPLGWHSRLWHWMGHGSSGDYWTLFGGHLCVDS